MNITAFPDVKPLDSPKIEKKPQQEGLLVHPFMLEGLVEEKRRRASAVANRDMILDFVNAAQQKDDDVRASDFDENLMMFGGSKFWQVRCTFLYIYDSTKFEFHLLL
jgi:hypothetical protein